MSLILEVGEARTIMGEDADKLTDEQIEELIILLDQMAREALKQARDKLKDN